jgi:hypothetical protein
MRLKREQRIKTITKELNLTGHFVEVGVLRGAFSNHLLQCNPAKLTLVDPWHKFTHDVFGDYKDFTQETYDLMYEKVKARFSKNPEVEVLRMLSIDGAKRFADNSLDLVYIDANHDYEYCYEDLNAWWGKVRKGGILCGHDFQHKGVNKAVKQFTAEKGIPQNFEITEEVGCATYFLIK